jgi:acyl carrier protein
MMNIREQIISTFSELLIEEIGQSVELQDSLELLDSGLDSLGLAILIVRLESQIGFFKSKLTELQNNYSQALEHISNDAYYLKEKDKIKQLVASNKALVAQDIILKAIEMQVGGSAAANVSAFDRITLATERMRDSIGEKLLPLIVDFSNYIADVVAPAVEKFFSDVSNPNTDVGKAFVAHIVGNEIRRSNRMEKFVNLLIV